MIKDGHKEDHEGKDRDKNNNKDKGIKLLNAKLISENKNGNKIVARYADLDS